jgi:hypothetical protein
MALTINHWAFLVRKHEILFLGVGGGGVWRVFSEKKVQQILYRKL